LWTFSKRGFPISAHRSGFITDFSKCIQTSLLDEYHPGFCWLFWELPPNLNWEILSTFLLTKYESEMNLGNNKQSNFAVEFISLNINIVNFFKKRFSNQCTQIRLYYRFFQMYTNFFTWWISSLPVLPLWKGTCSREFDIRLHKCWFHHH
jgi:hypothetical protein